MTAWTSRNRLFAALGVLALAVLVLAAAPAAQRAIETFGALEAIAEVGRRAEEDSSAHRNRVWNTGRQVSYLIDGRYRTADLYVGSHEAKAALVLVPGADALGRTHPQFRALAGVLSELGFAVLVPHMENLQQLRIRAGDIVQIADAARHMARFAPRDKGPAVGVAAVSYGVGPAVLAALTKDAGPHIRFVLGIGGYYDLEAVLTFLTTGQFRADARSDWQRAEPLAHGKWVFLASNAEFLEEPQDQVTLRLVARRKFADPRAEVNDLTPLLTPQGRAVYDLITNQDPARVPELLGRLPPDALAQFRALDVSEADLSALRARLILVHGRHDRLIPYTEGKALARAARNSPRGAHFYLISNMAHMQLSPSHMGDAWKLFRAVYDLLSERDAAPRPAIPRALAEPLDLKAPEGKAAPQVRQNQGSQ